MVTFHVSMTSNKRFRNHLPVGRFPLLRCRVHLDLLLRPAGLPRLVDARHVLRPWERWPLLWTPWLYQKQRTAVVMSGFSFKLRDVWMLVHNSKPIHRTWWHCGKRRRAWILTATFRHLIKNKRLNYHGSVLFTSAPFLRRAWQQGEDESKKGAQAKQDSAVAVYWGKRWSLQPSRGISLE